jgi:protein-S-isoprenylcysteine O-methyltransferase Ste14
LDPIRRLKELKKTENTCEDAERLDRESLMLRLGKWSYKNRNRSLVILVLLILVVCYHHNRTFSLLNWQISFPLIVLGQIIRIWSVGVRESNLHLNMPVTAGPYAYLRNPSYLGTFFIVLGIVIMGGLFLFIPIYVALFFLLYQPTILWEEDKLARKYGEPYLTYRSTVPRWIPSIRPYPHRSAHTFLIREAFKREWGMILAILGLSLLMSMSTWLR